MCKREDVLIAEAWAVQDACNLSGVVRSFCGAMAELWQIAHEQGQGTDWVNGHLVAKLYANKAKQLAGELEL
jgi:hypothetical protein